MMQTHVVLGGIVLQSIWYVAIAALLSHHNSWASDELSMPP